MRWARRAGFAGTLLAALLVTPARADDLCRKVLGERVKTCTDACVARAKAAVDPVVAERIKGYGCAHNCSKLEMFAGHGCPEDGAPH